MPKIKSHSGLSKRLKKNGNNKYKHKKINTRHILTKKTTKRKRQLRKKKFLDSNKTIQRMIN